MFIKQGNKLVTRFINFASLSVRMFVLYVTYLARRQAGRYGDTLIDHCHCSSMVSLLTTLINGEGITKHLTWIIRPYWYHTDWIYTTLNCHLKSYALAIVQEHSWLFIAWYDPIQTADETRSRQPVSSFSLDMIVLITPCELGSMTIMVFL